MNKFVQTTAKREVCPVNAMKEGQIVREILANYTKQLPEGEDAVSVEVEMHVQVNVYLCNFMQTSFANSITTLQDISSLNELTSDFEIDILFSQLWHDPGLSFLNYPACKRNITMESKYLEKIWTPNTCIINSKQSMIHKSPTDNIMFILYEV